MIGDGIINGTKKSSISEHLGRCALDNAREPIISMALAPFTTSKASPAHGKGALFFLLPNRICGKVVSLVNSTVCIKYSGCCRGYFAHNILCKHGS